MKGSDTPRRLYTIDVDSRDISLEPEAKELNPKQLKIQRVYDRIKRNKLRESAFAGETIISKMFMTNEELIEMRKPYPEKFFETYNTAFNLYDEGDWKEAKKKFKEVIALREDKPS